jgi:hypothetical protein
MKVNYYLVVYRVSPDNLFSPLFFAIAVPMDRGARRRGPAFSARGKDTQQPIGAWHLPCGNCLKNGTYGEFDGVRHQRVFGQNRGGASTPWRSRLGWGFLSVGPAWVCVRCGDAPLPGRKPEGAWHLTCGNCSKNGTYGEFVGVRHRRVFGQNRGGASTP